MHHRIVSIAAAAALVALPLLTGCGGSVTVDADDALREVDRQRQELVADLQAQQQDAVANLHAALLDVQTRASGDVKNLTDTVRELLARITQLELDIRCQAAALRAEADRREPAACD